MKLKLETPWNPGMNDPGQTYPEIYITQMTDNPSGGNFQFIYEAGSFQNAVNVDGSTSDTLVWVKGPGCLSQIQQVDGDDYLKAIKSPIIDPADSAYNSIRRILYLKLISSGLEGEIVDT